VFIREPAAEVVDELRHYYKQKIRIADPRLARQPLTLTFPFSNASDLGATLDRDPKVEVTTDEDGTLALHWQR
jgi:ferric-dicitrate binding protein FerR (iron transport regulator)